MSCRACTHWDRYKGDTAELGDCRRYPPRINDQLLARVLPGLRTPLSDHDEIERDLYVASAFPITHESSGCGEFYSEVPL